MARCLQHDPARRYASMTELVAALDHPESADLAILDAAGGPTRWQALLHNTALKATLISVGIIAVLVILAVLLQGCDKSSRKSSRNGIECFALCNEHPLTDHQRL